jgi:hypothetical protein
MQRSWRAKSIGNIRIRLWYQAGSPTRDSAETLPGNLTGGRFCPSLRENGVDGTRSANSLSQRHSKKMSHALEFRSSQPQCDVLIDSASHKMDL